MYKGLKITTAKVIHSSGLPLICPYHLTVHNSHYRNQTGHRAHQSTAEITRQACLNSLHFRG